MKKKKITIVRKISVPPGGTVAVLSPVDLKELNLRHQTLQSAVAELQRATFTKLMVEESYQSRVEQTLLKHGCRGQYDIDMKTGALTPKEAIG